MTSKKKMGRWVLLGLVIAGNYCSGLRAQPVPVSGEVKIEKKVRPHEQPLRVEITDKLLSSDLYTSIQQQILRLKSKKRQEYKRKSKAHETEISFYVRDVLDTNRWNTIKATRIFDGAGITLWLEASAYDTLQNSAKLQSLLDDLNEILFHKTPILSVDPDKGILSLLDEYAGAFPDVDSDGVLDVLLLDIQDNFEETGGFVAGFFDPVNLVEHEFSNERDLIYIDIYPTIFFNGEVSTDRAASTFAHETQHLIHAGYEGENPELVFVNEGYSEAIEILFGFPPRNEASYLNNSLRPFFYWEYENPIPDYVRASLWTHYLTEQFGADVLPELIQNPLTGIEGIEEVLNENSHPDFETVFKNWGKALTVNDIHKDPAWGYQHPERQDIQLQPSFHIFNLPDVAQLDQPWLSHAVISYALTNELSIENQSEKPAYIQFTALSNYPDGSKTIREISADNHFEVEAKSQPHGSVELVSSVIDPKAPVEDSISVNIFAEGAKSGVSRIWQYDDGIADTFYRNASYLMLESENDAFGMIFSPEETPYWLHAFSARTLFLSELEGSGIEGDAKRDFSVDIYTVRKGEPNEKIISDQVFEVAREPGNLIHEGFSLTGFYKELSGLEDSIAIVIKNDPDDQNYIALAMDEGTGNHTLYGTDITGKPMWESLAELTIQGNSLENWNPIIRAHAVVAEERIPVDLSVMQAEYNYQEVLVSVTPQIEYDTASVKVMAKLPDDSYQHGTLLESENSQTHMFRLPIQTGGPYTVHSRFTSEKGKNTHTGTMEWEIDLPDGFVLHQNYPNPFNFVTNVPFVTLEHTKIGWQVFDILGRVVQHISPELYESGEHVQRFNLNGLASGVYFIRAEVIRNRDNKLITRNQKILLIK